MTATKPEFQIHFITPFTSAITPGQTYKHERTFYKLMEEIGLWAVCVDLMACLKCSLTHSESLHSLLKIHGLLRFLRSNNERPDMFTQFANLYIYIAAQTESSFRYI